MGLRVHFDKFVFYQIEIILRRELSRQFASDLKTGSFHAFDVIRELVWSVC